MKKRFAQLFVLILIIIGVIGYWAYQQIWGENINLSKDLLQIEIPSGTDLRSLEKIFEDDNLFHDVGSFQRTAKLMKFNDQSIKPGRYVIKNGISNRTLIQQLRLGRQEAIKLTFNNLRTIEDFAGNISKKIEADSLSILSYLKSEDNLENWKATPEELLCHFVPNTYEVYWTWSIEMVMKRLKTERDKFWAQKNRLAKAKKLGMNATEVCILASIVEKETLVKAEKPDVARVYLNRINRGIPLQADPTVVFAVGDFTIRRVLNKHLRFESPYNTYINPGLPPGPIYLPNQSSIDAVLENKVHNYLYFCAKADNSGRHAFAATLTDHNRNARKYQSWLNSKGIKK